MQKRIKKNSKSRTKDAIVIFDDAEVLFDDEWEERKKRDTIEYVVPESEVISIRFSKEDVGKRVRFFVEKK